jgi:formamidopyrimidine-DNA glycosylase
VAGDLNAVDLDGARQQLLVGADEPRDDVERAVFRLVEVVERVGIAGIGLRHELLGGRLPSHPASVLAPVAERLRVRARADRLQQGGEPLEVLTVERRRDVEVPWHEVDSVQHRRARAGQDVADAVLVEQPEQSVDVGRAPGHCGHTIRVPELPEVETIRVALEPLLVGRRIERAEILDERLTRPEPPEAVAQQLAGEQIEAVHRRGKYLLLRLASGRVLLVHLRMTGSFRSDGGLHTRAVLALDDGTSVTYRDVRRFGTWLLLDEQDVDPYLAARLGDEPLERRFTLARLAGRRAPVKAAILDQRTVPGLGNIYADEALWRARLHPLRPAGSLDDEELRRLRRGIREALRAGIARQGATLSDYAAPDGTAGSMQREFKVYGRSGEPCDRCGTPIEKTRVAGRGTWFCPNCQT